MLFRQIFDPKLAQYAYLIGCQQTGEALIIDPERDIDQYAELAEQEGLTITAATETHIHADFLSGVREFAERFGTKLYLSAEGEEEGWASNWAKESAYDVTFLHDGNTFMVGNIEIKAVHTPGHTPEHMSFVVIDRGSGATTPIGIATGDFLFVGDLGRPDLLEQAAGMHGVQEPSARTLYHSLPKLRELQDYIQVWPAHGAGSTCGKALGAVPQSTVGYEKLYNASLGAANQGEDAFVDAILSGQPEPQMYFARMKRDNRDGVPILGTLPTPQKLTVGEFGKKENDGETLILDTRLDRSAFMAKHVPGALHTPMNKSFNSYVGSLIIDETTPIVLIIEEGSVTEAVRDLVRIGYDNLVGYITLGSLERYFNRGGTTATIEEITFEELNQMQDNPGVAVLDVRFASEFAEGHVPDAINASNTRLPDYVKDRVPQGKTLLVHCATGARSAAAAAFLARQGYDVKYVGGNFTDYQAIGEVEKGEPVAA
ncbi:MAG TPA: rhodanese-like domain-containing protein [Rhodothermales bacterium]|nr:rhodanese-like domain-containing protein [Rhodothermales bacterium]